MPTNPKYFRFAFAVICIMVLALAAYHGYCFYEDNEDAYCSAIMRGTLTGAPDTLPNTTGAWVGITYVLSDLFKWNINFDWYAIFLLVGYGFVIFQLTEMSRSIYNYAQKFLGKWPAIFLMIGFGLLFSEHFFIWQLTRLSMLLSGFAILNFSLDLLKSFDKGSSRLWYWFNLCCFIFAALIRLEPAVLNLLIGAPMILLALLQGTGWIKLKVFVLPCLAVIIISIIVNTPFNNTDSNYLTFRKYQFSIFDYKQPLGSLHLTNAKDSIIYTAASMGFISDSSQLNPAFFNKIGILPMDKTPSAIPFYFQNLAAGPVKIKKAWLKLSLANPGTALLYILSTLAGLLFVFIRARKSFQWYLIAQLWLILLLVGITSFIKMENRVLIPMLWLFMFETIIWCASLTQTEHPPKRILAIIAVCALFILPPLYLDGSAVSGWYHSKIRENKDAAHLLTNMQIADANIIVWNGGAFGKFNMFPFEQRPLLQNKHVISLDNFQLFWLATYRPYMQQVCGKSDFKGIAESLISKKMNVVFISQKARMELLKDYCRTIYNIDMEYEAISEDNAGVDKNEARNGGRFNLYRLK